MSYTPVLPTDDTRRSMLRLLNNTMLELMLLESGGKNDAQLTQWIKDELLERRHALKAGPKE